MGDEKDLSTCSSLGSAAQRPSTQEALNVNVLDTASERDSLARALHPQAQLHFSSQLDSLSQTVFDLQRDIAHFKQLVQDATEQASKVKTVVAHEISTQLSQPAASALDKSGELQLLSQQLSQAIPPLLPPEGPAKSAIESLLNQQHQKHSEMASEISRIHQALENLLRELNKG